MIDHDDLWPRDAAHRFRIYAVVGEDMTVLAATPTAEGIGTALVELHNDQKKLGRRLADHGRIGVFDVLAGPSSTFLPRPSGEWIVQPWDRRPA